LQKEAESRNNRKNLLEPPLPSKTDSGCQRAVFEANESKDETEENLGKHEGMHPIRSTVLTEMMYAAKERRKKKWLTS